MNTYVYMIEIAHFIFIYFVFNDNVFMLRVKILISVQMCCIYILAWQVFQEGYQRNTLNSVTDTKRKSPTIII